MMAPEILLPRMQSFVVQEWSWFFLFVLVFFPPDAILQFGQGVLEDDEAVLRCSPATALHAGLPCPINVLNDPPLVTSTIPKMVLAHVCLLSAPVGTYTTPLPLVGLEPTVLPVQSLFELRKSSVG
jgi:hypothetical protein